MSKGLEHIDDRTLSSLVAGLKSGRLSPPFTALQFGQYATPSAAAAIASAAERLADLGMTPGGIAAAFELVLEDRQARGDTGGAIDLVTSGPEAPGVANRDTAVVVREMFKHAAKSVLVVGYAVYQGQRVFEALAERMEQNPTLGVRLFLNVARGDRETTKKEVVLTRFSRRFKESQWPAGARLPMVYFDPRSVADDEQIRSSLHAKCVVVDEREVFVSSANFTEAGQERNIEVGLRISSQPIAGQLTEHFNRLVEHNLVERLI